VKPETAAAADIDQRRHLTIFFSDLSDSTRIAASMEPEDYAELLQQLRDLCERIIPRHGGEIVRIDGDGVLCIFGYPVAHDDAGRRATEAALDLHNAASALDQSFALPDMQIRLHSGIHSGVVLVRPGDIVRGRFEMLGDATNVAARLCDHAAADEVLVSEASLGADLAFFAVGPRREIRLSGRRRGLSVYPVAGREPTANRFAARLRRGVALFAGRAAQIARLDALLDECRAGVTRLAVLTGPAGIGKTRLANEFLDRAVASGATGLLGYCEAYLGARPLQPFIQILRALTGEEHRASDTALVPLLLIPALAARLACARAGEPVILSIDDWQWADDATRRLLDAIRAQTQGPLLILLSTRDDDPGLAEIDGATFIAVPPFAPAEATAAIKELVATPDPFLVDRIRDQSGGSPLFIEELCHAPRGEHGDLAQGDRNAWLDMLIQTRFARLSVDEAALVNVAAVIGHMVPGWLFEAVTGLGADDLAMQNLASEDFLYEGETPGLFRFKHGITRDAVYRTVGLRHRRTLHTRVAAALHERGKADGEEPYFEALAYHHDAAGDGERAVHYAVLAGDKAMAVSALDRAQAHYRQAVEGLLKLPDAAGRTKQINRAILRFGFACVADPSPDQLDVLAAAAASATAMKNFEGTTLCGFWQGTICYGLGEAQSAIAYLEHAMTTNESLGSPRMAAQLKANLGQSYSAAGNYPMAEFWLDAAIPALKENVTPGMETGLAYSLACRGFMYADQGHFAKAAPYYAEADRLLEVSEAPLRGSIVTQQAAMSIWQENFDAARMYAERGIYIGRASRSRYYVMMSSALRGFAMWRSSGDPDAVHDLEKAAQWFMSGASRQRTSLCFGWLAEIMADQGKIAETRFYAAQALRRARAGDRLGEAVACRAMAQVAGQGFGPRSAAHYLVLAEKSATVRQSPREAALNRQCAAEL
jgi:class 3 adenylate cyclase/tetratricopeptide (TPR) repeat protein